MDFNIITDGVYNNISQIRDITINDNNINKDDTFWDIV